MKLKEKYKVVEIDSKKTYDFILNKHYAQRKPSISFAFGLYDNDMQLKGVLTIGKPASNHLCEGVCGKEYSKNVYELNRLCVSDGMESNVLSFFVSSALKKLKGKDLILVSYADECMGHHGYIYQATNWIYTGKTVERTDRYMPGNKHSRRYTDEYKHIRKFRSSKHRYIYFTSKGIKKECVGKLNYEMCDYPKGDNERYELGDRMKVKLLNTITNEIFYEKDLEENISDMVKVSKVKTRRGELDQLTWCI